MIHALTVLVLVFTALPALAEPNRTAGIVIYGATPAGLSAARAATREGASVIVVQDSHHIGGTVAGGIAVTDTGTPQFVGGIAREFFEEAATHHDAEQPFLYFHGKAMPWRAPRRWDVASKTARAIFERWVREDGYPLLTGNRITAVAKKGAAIESITLLDGSVIRGKVFIDASYEGDLMALAGVESTYGRESMDQYGESLAGLRAPHFKANYPPEYYQTPGLEYTHHGQFGADISGYDGQGRLLWGVDPTPTASIGSADQRLQAYCYRLISTQRKDLLAPWPKPALYEPHRYELLLRYVLAHPGISLARLVHFGAIGHGKFDLNASGPFSIDYVGGNPHYPAASPEQRRRIWLDHENYQKGFFWFLAHDPRVPAELREEVNSWGLARDEFPENGHYPPQLYIRESRRMLGAHVTTEHDILKEKTKPDSMGMGSFVLDSHWVQRYVTHDGFVRVEGHLDESISLARAPYQIAYRSLTPKPAQATNLLVPVCLSATHVAICTIRMEPVYMVLGHSAGVAAVMALRSGQAVQEVDIPALRRKLVEQGQVLEPPK